MLKMREEYYNIKSLLEMLNTKPYIFFDKRKKSRKKRFL